jgi:hypothetical protein
MPKAATIGLTKETKSKLRKLKVGESRYQDSYEDTVLYLLEIIKGMDQAFTIAKEEVDKSTFAKIGKKFKSLVKGRAFKVYLKIAKGEV